MSQIQEFCEKEKIQFFPDKDLTTFSTLKLKARGHLAEPDSLEKLQILVKFLKGEGVGYQILGWGANTLLPETSDLIYIRLDFPFDKNILATSRDEYVLPASVGINVLTAHAIRFGLAGWESFTGVPASLGGAIFMNAGTALGEIGEVIKEVTILDKKCEYKKVKIDDGSFSYRQNNFLEPGEIIVEAILTHNGCSSEISEKIKEYIEYRKKTQPLTARTCGCVFKNKANDKDGSHVPGCRAGEIIDKIGLKGFRYKNLRVSPVHANFIENMGESTYSDFMEFVEIITNKIKEETGLTFEFEVRI